jgi:hypothetical protein
MSIIRLIYHIDTLIVESSKFTSKFIGETHTDAESLGPRRTDIHLVFRITADDDHILKGMCG